MVRGGFGHGKALGRQVEEALYVRATLAHQCPVYSFVIYLLANGKVPESPLIWGLPGYRQAHIFDFTNIKLRDLSVDAFRKMGLKGLLPLCLLTKDGARREVGEEVLASLRGNDDLLNLAIALASLVLTGEADKQWLERRVAMLEEILQDTWYYKWIHDRGLTEGQEKGRAEALQEALEEDRRAVLEAIRARFPEMAELAQQCIDQIHDSATLKELIIRVPGARDKEGALRALHEMDSGL